MLTNRLQYETSPYLLQHANNPVAWQPWDEEALALARKEDKPILLSIGYSACHWCHVMAHESFEDGETAHLMNALFINIKVDREERPDLDKIYQSCHQLLSNRPGGWPLTIFLEPQELIPFFAGTYFPLQPRYGMPSFKDVLQRIAHFFQEHRQDIKKQNEQVKKILLQIAKPDAAVTAQELNSMPLAAALEQLAQDFDQQHGGFGGAPKFPQPSVLRFLLETASATAKDMLQTTLLKMSRGGLFDQLGGGFFRYAVDERWEIPHFEKMLYDNGQLLSLYTSAAQILNDPQLANAAKKTAEWVIREMQAPTGGYYSSLDADVNGQEGQYYYWTREEIQKLLTGAEFQLLTHVFNLNQEPNFEGRWHLTQQQSVTAASQTLQLNKPDAQALFSDACRKLLSTREQRTKPQRDEKILTSWNGLMIKGMAEAGRWLQEPAFLASAQQAVNFIKNNLWRNKRLFASYKDKQARFMAYLDDYAYLLDGLLSLLQAQWNTAHLRFAIEIADALLEHFLDAEGGFFFTAHDHEQLIQRPKILQDDSAPSGNGIAALALLHLGHLLGETRYLQVAENTLRSAWQRINRAPYAHASLLMALKEYLEPAEILLIYGKAEELSAWRGVINKHYSPKRLAFTIPTDDQEDLAKLLPTYPVNLSDTYATLCRQQHCEAPIKNLAELKQLLTKPN